MRCKFCKCPAFNFRPLSPYYRSEEALIKASAEAEPAGTSEEVTAKVASGGEGKKKSRKMARRAYEPRNRGREMETEVEEVAVVKVAVKVELDIALCMDPQVRREGGKECSLLGAGGMQFHLGGCKSDEVVRQDGGSIGGM